MFVEHPIAIGRAGRAHVRDIGARQRKLGLGEDLGARIGLGGPHGRGERIGSEAHRVEPVVSGGAQLLLQRDGGGVQLARRGDPQRVLGVGIERAQLAVGTLLEHGGEIGRRSGFLRRGHGRNARFFGHACGQGARAGQGQGRRSAQRA